MSILQVFNLRKEFRSKQDNCLTLAVSDVNFVLKEKDFMSIIGSSGSGKTTLVKMIAGLIRPTSGTISINGEMIASPSPVLTMVFQDYGRSLLPWKRVADNIAFGMHNVAEKRQRNERLMFYLDLVGLTDFSNYYPWELSGGMQQRVALARALAKQPDILILDEPFGSLDAQSRFELEDELLRIWEQLGITIILVTHDIDEAIYLSNRILVMGRPNQTVQADVPVHLPRPRQQLQTRSLREFLLLREEIYILLQKSSPPLRSKVKKDEDFFLPE